MGTVRIGAAARVGFGDATQHGLLKPTAVWRLMSGALDHWWPEATGLDGPEFLDGMGLRSAMVQLDIERLPVPVPDEQELLLDLAKTFGAAPGTNGRPPRFGGVDRLTLRRADGSQDPVAHWTAWWLWFRQGEQGRLRLLDAPVPGLLVDQDDELTGMQPPPAAEDGTEEASRFRWTARETDLNEHVFFLSYVERAENALADAGMDTSGLYRWRAWFQRPAFLGERMTACVAAQEDGALVVALRNEERAETSALVRACG